MTPDKQTAAGQHIMINHVKSHTPRAWSVLMTCAQVAAQRNPLHLLSVSKGTPAPSAILWPSAQTVFFCYA